MSPAFRMLVVEDDLDIGTGLKDYFELNGYEVTVVSDGQQALDVTAAGQDFDVVLLDVMLPKVSGFEVLQVWQEIGFTAPVLLLTARGEQESILKGFGLGANDYVVKPFSVEEPAARVRAILVRTLPPDRAPMDTFRFGKVQVNFSTHEAYNGAEQIPFTALEFEVLRYLIQNRGRIVTRRQLLRDVWGIDQDIATRTIDRHIASVRKKIEVDPSMPPLIETVYGVGYRFMI